MASSNLWRVIGRYALFQIPDLVLLGIALAAIVRWWDLPLWGAYTIAGLWIVKDAVMFPLLRVAYEAGPGVSDRLAGAHGVAKQVLDPTGYVAVGSESWSAEVHGTTTVVAAGERVRVIGVRGLTLLVEPLTSAEPD